LALAGVLSREIVSLHAEVPAVASAGRVASAEEGPMDGVLGSAQKNPSARESSRNS